LLREVGGVRAVASKKLAAISQTLMTDLITLWGAEWDKWEGNK
jgi:hypothetical protein